MINQVIDYLNEKTGSHYKATAKSTTKHIEARINEGATLEQFKQAIDNKVASWRGTQYESYLRPDTLFSGKFWGYANESSTDMTQSSNRRDLIKAVLKAAGYRDITEADVTIYGEVMKLIPSEELPQFAVSLIRSGGEFMRPDQMISEAVKKFEYKIITERLQTGGKISDYERFHEFMQYSFRGKAICNDLKGIFKPFVTIGMDRDGNLVNQFVWRKLSSEDEQRTYKWLFENQNRIGIVENIEMVETENLIEHKKEDENVIESQPINNIVGELAKGVRV